MQLTKAEIADTQVIVTTPEKWDVVTRKPTGEGELASVRPPSLSSFFVNLVCGVLIFSWWLRRDRK